MEKTGDKTKHYFSTNVLLKSIIGKDLINNDNIAVIELVKNSFDARSPKVDIVFKNLKVNDDLVNKSYSDKSSKLLIMDYGVGMDENDIIDKWFNIAYSEKKKHLKQQMTTAGAKGVGRFSCDRLGEYLDLYTRRQGQPIYHIFIDWKDFEVEERKDLTIQDIAVEVEQVSEEMFEAKFAHPLDHGTFIEISKLRSRWVEEDKRKKEGWNTSKILDLRHYLEKLINPNRVFSAKGFTIELSADEFKESDALKKEPYKVNGPVENKIFEKLDYTTTVIESEISPGGEVIKTTLTDKGRKILELEEKNTIFDLLQDIKIVIFYLNPYAKAYFKRQTGIRSVDFGSIFLFINGFRVNPLGDAGDDWLRMEVRKGQGYAKFLGTRELVGRIEINDTSNHFRIISSREGIVKDRRFDQIVDTSTSFYKGFFYRTLRKLEKYVVEGLDWDRTTATGKEIEKEVDSLRWRYDPAEEKYLEKQSIKDDRIRGMINALLLGDTNPGDVLRFYFNEDLVIELLQEERDKVKEKFEQFVKNFSSFAPGIIDEASREAIQRVERELQERLRAKNLELQKAKQEIERVQEEKEALTREKETLKKEVIQQKVEIKDLREDKKKYKEQVYFLKDHLEQSGDYTQVIELHHQIGISAGTIDNHLVNLRNEVEKNHFSRESLLEYIDDLSFETNKIKIVSDVVSRASFHATSPELKKQDLTSFIIQYINEVSKANLHTLEQNLMQFHLDTGGIEDHLIRDFNWIEIAMLFDNLFNNSKKARATKIDIQLISSEKELTIKVRDDGTGIPTKNKDKIFDFGFSTTGGTGLGLYHIKKILTRLDGEIYLNEKMEKGCEFVITIKEKK